MCPVIFLFYNDHELLSAHTITLIILYVTFATFERTCKNSRRAYVYL